MPFKTVKLPEPFSITGEPDKEVTELQIGEPTLRESH